MAFTAYHVRAGASRMLSGILDQITISLQLNDTQKVRARQAYSAVTDWLAAPGSGLESYSPWLFPQGSLAQDTTVRPISRSEFDLDVICHLDYPESAKPEDLFQLIWDRIHRNETYRPLMTRESRCIRLNYAEDSQFHLDIVPAIPDRGRKGDFILIPDGSGSGAGMTWKTSNPIGFKEWLEEQKAVVAFAEKRARVDPLDDPLPAEQKAALTKSIQLFKRWRDICWEDEPKLATPSIVLTYLAARGNPGEGSLATSFDYILDRMAEFADGGETEILSPVNDQEIISEKWLNKPASHDAFVEEIRDLRRRWDGVLEVADDPSRGIAPLAAALKDIFGEAVDDAVKSAIHEPVKVAREEGSLLVEKKSGRLVAGAVPAAVKPVHATYKQQTFYGDGRS